MGVVTDEDLEYQAAHIAEALDGKRVGQGWQCFCPVHEKDGSSQHETRSLGIDLKDGTILFNCRSLGCHRDNGVINALIEMGLWKKRGDASWDDYRETASYPYLDEFGQFVSTKKRLELEVWSERGQKLVKDKKFSFSPSVKGNDRLTFFRAELLGMWPNRSVIVLEGEKCVLAVEKHTGLLAVTLPTGANTEWTDHQTTLMTGRKVILIPDRDDPGAAWIRNAISALWGVAESIRIVTLPGMDDPKDDTYDWFELYGHSKDEFIQVVKTTNPLTERDRDLIVSPNNVSSEPAPEVSDVPESAPIVEMGSTAEEAERSVLAHLLLAPDKVESVTSELFTLPAHRLIIKAMLDLYEGQSRWDTLTIADHLESKNELEKIGGRLFLDKLRPGDFESHLAILERNAKARKIKDLSKNLAVIADGPESAEEKQRAAEEAFLSSTERSERHPVQKLDVFITQALQEIDEAHARGGEPLGFKTGYPTLDKLLGGIDRGLLAILGAPTSMGKTALALNFASNMALAGNKVLFFEMEMRGSELAKRLLTIRAARHGMGLRSDQIKTGQLLDGDGNQSDELWDQLMAVAAENALFPMWIDESSSQTTASIWSRSERLKREVGLDVIFIDYLGIMTMPKAENMTRATGMISGELRRMARDLDVAIIAMSQLNRDAMKRGESRLYDIKDANKPAEDAHYALLLQKDQDPKTARPDVIDVKVEKNRNGPTGQVPLFYKANSFAFFEIGHE